MKIDLVLTACDENEKYLSLAPYYFEFWEKKIGLSCVLILIAENIPSFLKKYEKQIILFSMTEVHSAYIAQVIRILYPALFTNKNVLITDVDMFPISKEYFVSTIQSFDNKTFISFTDRYIKELNELAICYNVANSNTWSEIFSIKTIEDIKNKLLEWYNSDYNGHKNCLGWSVDQKKLFEYVFKWSENNKDLLVVLKDENTKLNRLDLNRRRNYSVFIKDKGLFLEKIKNNEITDVHTRNKNVLNAILRQS